MLQFIDKPVFSATVVVHTAHTRGDFEASFVALPSSELAALEQRCTAEGQGPAGILGVVCVGLSDVLMPDGTPAGIDWLLDQPGVGPAMVQAYYRGLWEAAEGNCARPPAGS